LLNQEESKDFHQIEHLFPRICEGVTRKKPRRVHAHIPNQIPKRKASNPPKKIAKKRLQKSQKKGKWERQHQALMNHAKSSIDTMKVHTRSSLPPNHLSQAHHETLKLVLKNPKENRKGKNKGKMS
jgi:hypothetical protein